MYQRVDLYAEMAVDHRQGEAANILSFHQSPHSLYHW